MNEECNRLNEEVFSIQEQLKNQNGQMEAGQAAYHREASRLDSLKTWQSVMMAMETVSEG